MRSLRLALSMHSDRLSRYVRGDSQLSSASLLREPHEKAPSSPIRSTCLPKIALRCDFERPCGATLPSERFVHAQEQEQAPNPSRAAGIGEPGLRPPCRAREYGRSG